MPFAGTLVNSWSRVAFWQIVHPRLGARERPHQDYPLQRREAAHPHSEAVVRQHRWLLGATPLGRDLWAFCTHACRWKGSPHQAQPQASWHSHSWTLKSQSWGRSSSSLLTWTEGRQGLEGATANCILLQQFISPRSPWGRGGKMSPRPDPLSPELPSQTGPAQCDPSHLGHW